MKLRSTLAALGLCAFAAGTAFAAPVYYFANLNGGNENPPNPSLGVGTSLLTIDTVLNTLRVEVMFSGLTGNVSAAHIHCCVAQPGNVGVASTTPSFPGFPSGGTSGSYDLLFDMTLASSYNPAFVTANGGTIASAFTALVSGLDLGRAYFNIHTSALTGGFPGGEIRGFFAIPEPGSLALLIGGLGLLTLRSRRSKAAAA